MGSQHSIARGSKISEVESGIEQDEAMSLYNVRKRERISRSRRNQHSIRPHSFGKSFGGNSKIIYNETLKGCSFKIYYLEVKKKTVVLLDCGEKVFANGKQVYPFDERKAVGLQGNDSGSRSSCDSAEVEFTEEPIVCSNETNSSGERLTLDTIMSQVTDTFQRAMLEEQQYTRKLEDENNTLCWNALELEQLRNKLEETEYEKKQVEDEVLKMSEKLKFVTSELLKLKELVKSRGKGLIELNGDVLNIQTRRRRRRNVRVNTPLKYEEGTTGTDTLAVIKEGNQQVIEQSKKLSQKCRCESSTRTSPLVNSTAISIASLSNLEFLKTVYQSSCMAEIMLKIILVVITRSLVGCICVFSLMFKNA